MNAPVVETKKPEMMKAAHLVRNTLMPTMLAALSFCRMQCRLKPNLDLAMRVVRMKVRATKPHITK